MSIVKQRPRVGDEAWFVEWCSKLAFYDDDPSGDVDRDNCKMSRRKVATEAEARGAAEEVWPRTQETFGVVSIWPARFVPYDEDDADALPHAGYWEVTDDPRHFSGEWEE